METVLLVDDDAGVRRSVGELLLRSGYGVRPADTGDAALDLLAKEGGVDVAIVDYRMPGMDGVALARRIKEHAPDLPVVIMTGYGDLESYLCAANLGVVRYIRKPIGLRELLRAVRDAIAEGLGARTLKQIRTKGR